MVILDLPEDCGGVEDQGDRGHEQQRRERPSLRAAFQASSCAPPCKGSKSPATGILLFSISFYHKEMYSGNHNMMPFVQHPAGDLSLLARAATEPQAQLEGSQVVTGGAGGGGGGGVKRRKTAPRKLATFLTSANSNGPSQQVVEEEEEEREKENQDLLQGLINRENLLQQANKLMHPVNLSNSNNKAVTNNFSASNAEPTSLDLSLPRSSPPRPSSEASSPPASPPSSTLSLLSSLQQVHRLSKKSIVNHGLNICSNPRSHQRPLR